MKICMVSPFGFQAATTRVRAYNLAKHLARGGDEVLLIVSGGVRKKEENLQIVGVGREEKAAKDFLISTLSRYFTLRKLKEFDVYHSFKALPWASIPALLAKKGGPTVLDLDDWETGSALDQGRRLTAFWLRVLEHGLPRFFDGVVVVSDWLKRMCVRAGVPESRILKLPYGCDVEKFRPLPRDEELARKMGLEGKRVVYVGSIGELNLHVLVEAMKLVIGEVKSAVLLAVSPGYPPEEFRKRAEGLGLPGDRLVVLGRQPHELMPKILSLADVVYAPNRFIEVDEARSPSRIGEYMAAGKPIVANAVGVVKEQLSDGAGSLVYSYGPQELATRIIDILLDGDLARRLGQKARERAEKSYSWRVLARRLRRFYDEIAW